ncbi:hypothetical protein DXG01_004863, partial [Tephrocybe rancida]
LNLAPGSPSLTLPPPPLPLLPPPPPVIPVFVPVTPVFVPATPVFAPALDSDPYLPPSMQQSQLYRAALTCKVFLGPALDLLWSSMDSIVPVLRLLPTIEEIDGVYMSYQSDPHSHMFTRKVQAEHIERLNGYGARIKTFCLNEVEQPRIHPFTLIHIVALLPLPHIQEFLCTSAQSLTTTTVPFIFRNTVKRFELKNVTDTNSHIIRPFLCTLQDRVPALEDLVLRDPLGVDSLTGVPDFQQLISLEFVGNIDTSLFLQIVTVPTLRKLIVDIIDSPPAEPPRSGDIFTILNLEFLHIKGLGASIHSFLLYLNGGRLGDVAVTLVDSDKRKRQVDERNITAVSWLDECLYIISSRWPTVHTLLLNRRQCPRRQVTDVLSFSAFERFDRLQNLELDPPLSLTRVLDVAAKNPTLVELKIHILESSPDFGFDLNFVKSLVETCPELALLKVKFNFCQVPLDTFCAHPVSTRLKTLILESKEPFRWVDTQTNAIKLAQYFYAAFPSLKNLHGAASSGAAFWSHVLELITMLQQVMGRA